MDRNNNIFIADYFNHRIQKMGTWSNQWNHPLQELTDSEDRPIKGGTPSGVYLDGDGNIYVSEEDLGRIQEIPGKFSKWDKWCSSHRR